jgi:hypothetical protein
LSIADSNNSYPTTQQNADRKALARDEGRDVRCGLFLRLEQTL